MELEIYHICYYVPSGNNSSVLNKKTILNIIASADHNVDMEDINCKLLSINDPDIKYFYIYKQIDDNQSNPDIKIYKFDMNKKKFSCDDEYIEIKENVTNHIISLIRPC